jgi:hypothetical protein
MAAVPASDSRVTITWNSFTNGTYRVEQKPDLAGPDWMAIGGDVVATRNTTSITNGIAGATQRFYRIRLIP